MAFKVFSIIRARFFNSASDTAFDIGLKDETNPRFQIDAGGKVNWGAGDTSTVDTNLYRENANILKTDDTFKASALFVDGVEIDPAGASLDDILKFDGTKFVPGVGGAGTATVTIQADPPSGGSAGDLWLDSDDDTLYILDTDDTTWISVTGSASLAGLSDVTLSSLQDGQILKYDGTNTYWFNEYEIPHNVDGGDAESNYGGIVALSGGGASG